jgi:hypothetical protein
MRLGLKPVLQCRGDARLAEAGFATDQHDLAVARLGARPAPQQQVDLLVAADHPGPRRSAQRLEPARNDTRTQYLPSRHRRGDPLALDGAEIAVFEEIAEQPARASRDDDRVRLGQGLQPGLDGDCQNIVNPLLDGTKYLSHSVSAANYGNYDDPTEIELYDRMLRETDFARQRQLMRQFELDTEAHEIFLLWRYRIVPNRSYVKGWKVSPSHYVNQDLATIWLDK